MKPSTKDQIQGTFREMKGAAKQKAGRITNNSKLVAEGHVDKLAGKFQKKIAQVEKVFGR